MDAVVEKADEMVKEEETVAEENLLTDETPELSKVLKRQARPLPVHLREPAKPAMLIVDDDEDMRQFVKAHFEKMYTVYTADNGKTCAP